MIDTSTTTSTQSTMSESDFIARGARVFCCPRCVGTLERSGDDVVCSGCRRTYSVADDIPRMFVPNEWEDTEDDVTDRMKQFYEKTPFPNYDDFDSAASLVEKARRGLFAKLLDDQLPIGARVLEAGCGTGQLTNFLSIANRTVVGADMCLNSLTMARRFRDANDLRRAHFIQMNLFRPCFRPASFDVVISNGVIHHTSDAKLAFRTLAKLVRPGGYLIVGLYHRFGRLATDLRRGWFNLTGDRLKVLDPRNVAEQHSTGKRTAWFMDQYKNPHETKHTIGEVLGWLRESNLEFVKSIPKTRIATPFSPEERLFEPEDAAGAVERTVREMSMALWPSQIREGGFFITIARAPRAH